MWQSKGLNIFFLSFFIAVESQMYFLIVVQLKCLNIFFFLSFFVAVESYMCFHIVGQSKCRNWFFFIHPSSFVTGFMFSHFGIVEGSKYFLFSSFLSLWLLKVMCFHIVFELRELFFPLSFLSLLKIPCVFIL